MPKIRVWALFVVYTAGFGIELTFHNIAAIGFFDNFDLTLATAGLIASPFGLMNLFTRQVGLKGRVRWLFIAMLYEDIALKAYSTLLAQRYRGLRRPAGRPPTRPRQPDAELISAKPAGLGRRPNTNQ